MNRRSDAPTVFLFLLVCVCITAASAEERPPSVRIVASLFPQYDFAKRIGGDSVSVRLLPPPGIDSHSYEPVPADIAAIAHADIFLYTGETMEPWAAKIVAAVASPGSGPKIVDVSRGVTLLGAGAEEEHAHGDGHDSSGEQAQPNGHSHALDPHFWLDPNLALVMAGNIAGALVAVDADNAALYRDNAEALKNDLRTLDADCRRLVGEGSRKTLVFGGKFAFAYFTRRYGLDHVGVYDGCGPGVEPSLRRIVEIVEYVKANGIPVVYHEELSEPRIARTIAAEPGARTAMLHSLHNLGLDESKAGMTYLDGMRNNLAAIAEGLK